MTLKRITQTEAEQFIPVEDNHLDYPAEYFTLVSTEDGWSKVKYYTGRKKINLQSKGDGKYWIYVLSNESMPGLLKIGYTNHSPEDKASMTSRSKGVPTPFKVGYSFKCNEGEFFEYEIHKELDSYRLNDDREFLDRKSTRLNSSHSQQSRMPSSA